MTFKIGIIVEIRYIYERIKVNIHVVCFPSSEHPNSKICNPFYDDPLKVPEEKTIFFHEWHSFSHSYRREYIINHKTYSLWENPSYSISYAFHRRAHDDKGFPLSNDIRESCNSAPKEAVNFPIRNDYWIEGGVLLIPPNSSIAPNGVIQLLK